MIAIEVEFLTGRYVATSYNSRQASEWPPHPARLFSALVATHFGEREPDPEEREVLEWIEGLDPPSIHASDASPRDVTTVFVPVNDVAMTDVDAEADAVEERRAELEAAQVSADGKAQRRAATALAKAERRLAKAIESQTTSVKKTNPAAARAVLPEHRTRQARTFPSVTPDQPRVTYVWPDADATGTLRARLDELLARLVRLGHSSSLIAARVVDKVGESRWRPATDGEETFRTTSHGQVAALERAFELHRETEPRVMPARFTSYTEEPPAADSRTATSLFGADWLVLRRVGGPSVPMVASAGVARTLRRALMSHVGTAPEILSGHDASGAPSSRDHLAIAPLSFVGHAKASGSILGFALILPRSATREERASAYRAVSLWEDSARLEDEETPRLNLTLGRAGVLELERVDWGAVPATLRASSWCRPSRSWHSATPVALDRNPGDLRSRVPGKLAKAVGEATATISAACERIGLPEPIDVEILAAAPLAGAAKAKDYPGYPEIAGRTRRVLTHVRLRFADPVRGPILLGAGRYNGLGLFRPEVDR